MRDGMVVTTRPLRDVTREEIVRLMVGRDVEVWHRPPKGEHHAPGDVALELRGGTVHGSFEDVDLI